MRTTAITSMLVACCAWVGAVGVATAAQTTEDGAGSDSQPLYVIYDSSNSMWAPLPDGQRKYEAARSAVSKFVAGQPAERNIAMRVYGARSKDDCRDSRLMVPMAADNQHAIVETVNSIRPTGQTPMEYSLRETLRDLDGAPADILVVTDGIESCDADPCALLNEWRRSNVNVRVHIVGLGLNEKDLTAMQCLVEATGNEIVDAQSEADLEAGLANAQAQLKEVDFGFVPNDDAGEPAEKQIIAKGQLFPEDETGEPIEVESHHRYTPPAGQYVLSAGVVTLSGATYDHVEVPVDLRSSKRIEISPPLPPLVRAALHDGIDKVDRVRIDVYAEGEHVGGFHSRDAAWLLPGEYEFRAEPNVFNKLSKTAVIAPDSRPVIEFAVARTAKIYVEFVSSQTGERVKNNPTLWRGEEQISRVLGGNGGTVPPGTYVAKINDGFAEYEAPITVTEEARQSFELEVPTGQIRITYEDAERQVQDQKRVFVYGPAGSRTRYSDEWLTLLPGAYRLQGHPRGSYPDKEIVVAVGDRTEFTLRQNPQ